jgi:hypothetical protein
LWRAFGAARRNDLAWIALGLSVTALVLRVAYWLSWIAPEARGLIVLPAIFGVILGLVGLLQVGDPQRGGAGQRPALTAILLGALLWFV